MHFGQMELGASQMQPSIIHNTCLRWLELEIMATGPLRKVLVDLVLTYGPG